MAEEETEIKESQKEETVNEQENDINKKITIWKEDSKKIYSLIEDLIIYKKDKKDTSIQAKYRKEQFDKTLIEINKKCKNKEIELKNVIVEDVEAEKIITLNTARMLMIKTNRFHKRTTRNSISTEKRIKKIYNKIKKNKKLTKKENKIINRLWELYNQYKLALFLSNIVKLEEIQYRKTKNYIVTYLIPKPRENFNRYDMEENNYNTESYEYDGKGIFIKKNEEKEFYKYTTMKAKIIKKEKDIKKVLEIRKGSMTPLKIKIKEIKYKENNLFEDEIIIEVE